MRKLFLFATVAAAGLFASCSSTDDAISEGGNPVENVDDGKTAIKIGISNIVNMAESRGTGTVGGVGDGDNFWAGQRINVFMFDKDKLALTKEGTTAMYDNAVMITPGTIENLVEGNIYQAPMNAGEAMLANGDIKYYPSTGKYDFFGYHLDMENPGAYKYYDSDAAEIQVGEGGPTAAQITAAKKIKVPFTIDGSNDLMSTKAVLTTEQAGIMDGKTGTNKTNYYSAYSARAGVHPTLTFDHLLTRLQFKVRAGNAASAGYGNYTATDNYKPNARITYADFDAFTGGSQNVDKASLWETTDLVPDLNSVYTIKDGNPTITAAAYEGLSDADKALFTRVYSYGQDPTRAVMIDEIKIFSKKSGKLLVSWTPDQEVNDPNGGEGATYMPAHSKIEWDEAPAPTAADYEDYWLALKERPYAALNANATIDNGDITAGKKPAIIARLEAEIAQLTAAIATETDNDKKTAMQTEKGNKESAITTFWAQISKETYDALVTTDDKGRNKYTKYENDGANENLMTLNPVAPLKPANYDPNNQWTVSANDLTSIGEALIVAPNEWNEDGTNVKYTAKDLQMRVKVSQRVPGNWEDYNADPTNLVTLEQTYNLDVPYPAYNAEKKGSGAFMINTSYNIILTVYGYDRIRVIAQVSPWAAGGNREIGNEDDMDDWDFYAEEE